MMKLPGRAAAGGSAGLPYQIVRFRFIFQGVQRGLYGAVNVVAELPSFVFGISFQSHVTSIAKEALLGYKTVQFAN
jgi:hypothetical protein